MKLTIVRHGETDFNKKKIIMGQRVDAPLNEIGKKQAEELISQLKEFNFNLILASPLKRAEETAQIIKAHLNLPIEFKDELKERDYGSLSGKTWKEIDKLTGLADKLKIADLRQDYDYRPYGGESVDQVKNRITKFIDNLKKEYPEKAILTVTHGGIIRIIYHMLKNIEIDRITNASLHEFYL